MQTIIPLRSASKALTTRRARLDVVIRPFSFASSRYKQRLVILGSGWGGYGLLRGIDKSKWGVSGCFAIKCNSN